jgi:hypothetical protein
VSFLRKEAAVLRSKQVLFISPFQVARRDAVTYTPTAAIPRDFTAIQRDMGDYIPAYYRGSKVAVNILDREAAELADLNAEIADVLAQFFIDTATWGLANWERICAIPTDTAKPIEQRRSAVKARLRGVGTVTVEMIKKVVESFANGSVDVTEDNVNYTVRIRYISTIGVPPNLPDIEAALRDIIPAHLAITYDFRYLTVNEVHNVMTLNTMQATLLNKFAPFV